MLESLPVFQLFLLLTSTLIPLMSFLSFCFGLTNVFVLFFEPLSGKFSGQFKNCAMLTRSFKIRLEFSMQQKRCDTVSDCDKMFSWHVRCVIVSVRYLSQNYCQQFELKINSYLSTPSGFTKIK